LKGAYTTLSITALKCELQGIWKLFSELLGYNGGNPYQYHG